MVGFLSYLQIKFAENSHDSHKKYLKESNGKEKRKTLKGLMFCPSEIIYIPNEK